MAKKKVSKVASKISAEVVDATVFGIDMTVTKDDVLAIAVSRAEIAYRQEIEQALVRLKKLEAQSLEQQQAIENEARVFSQSKADAVALDMNAVVDKHNLKTQHFKGLSEGAQRLGGDLQLFAVVVLGSALHYFRFAVDPSDELKKMNDAYQAKIEEIKNLEREIVSIRKKLSNIGVLERQYRAKFAEEKLNQTPQGQQLLRNVLASLEKDIQALPCA